MSWIVNMSEETAAEFDPGPNTACISIVEPKRKNPPILKTGYIAVLRLEFQDWDPLRKHPPEAIVMNDVQAQWVADLATSWRALGANIVVHCSAGVSRSGGIVEALLDAFPEYEDLKRIRYPNTHVKNLVKRALGVVPIGAEVTA